MLINSFSLDQDGELLIKGFEALRLKPYLDCRGIPTQGWGHTQGISLKSLPVSVEQARKWFLHDSQYFCEVVNEAVKVMITQNQFNALVSFAYNVGAKKFLASTLLARVNAKDPKAAEEFPRWSHYEDPLTGEMKTSQGLLRRRQAEQKVFLG